MLSSGNLRMVPQSMEEIEVQEKSNASIESENQNQNERLVNEVRTMLESLGPPLSTKCHIKRIPDYLRNVNEQSYTPRIISIGPIHHFNEKLRTKEKFKLSCLKNFIERTEINLENLVSSIREMEESIHCCYADDISRSMHSDDFVKMILVDAIFIIELFIRYDRYDRGERDYDDLIMRDQLFIIPFDLVLLENQLPFFVLEKLFNLAFPNHSTSSSLIHITLQFFNNHFNVQKISSLNMIIQHLTDLFKTFLLPPSQSIQKRSFENAKLLYSASQLHEAGVKFKMSSSKCLLDIKFDLKNGVLEIPCLELYDETVRLIRNVMAFEQTCYTEKCIYLMDYSIFLDDLINTTKDMDLLCNKGIVANYLGDNEAAKSIINNLNINVYPPSANSNYIQIYKDLNAFYQKPSHRWKATLMHQYFSTPWRGASTIAAVTLLVLTLIQTICSIIQIVPIV